MTDPDLWWLAGSAGERHGPFARSELAEAVRSLGLGDDARVWRAGAARWERLEPSRTERVPPAWRAVAETFVQGVFGLSLAICALLVWTPSWGGLPVGMEGVVWATASIGLLVSSVALPILRFTRGRARDPSGSVASEARAAGAVITVIAAICGLALALFALHLMRPAVDLARATWTFEYRIHADPVARQVTVAGSIGPGFARRFKRALRQIEGPATVNIQSSGGLVDEALAAAKAIEARGGSTVIARRVCASACLLLLMAGDQRLAESTMLLDFHATATVVETDNRLVNWNARRFGVESDAYLSRRGVPPELIAAAERAGSEKLLSLSPVAALEAGVLTAVLHEGRRVGIADASLLPPLPARRIRPVTDALEPWF